MRDLLTVLAIVLIVILTAALAAPYFIDWNGQRAFVEARLSHALGQKVTIGGAIDLKLLPTPYIALEQTVIGSDDGPIRVSIHHLDLQLSVAPLLHGAFEVVDAQLEEPTIRVRLEPDRTLPALPDAPAFQADVAFDRVTVAGGTLAIADPQSGHTFVFDNLDLTADAPSLAGPFKVNGAGGAPGARTTFRLSTTAAQGGRARAHLVVAEGAGHAGLDLDGTLALTSAARDTVRQSFDGTVALSGQVDDAERAPIAWRLSGPLKADASKATLAGGELRLGGDTSGLTLSATGEADLGATPSLHLDLTAKQLDVDRLAGAPVDQVAPPPPKLPDMANLRRALATATPPLPTVLDVSIDTATWGGETLSDLAAHVGLGGSGPRPLQVGGNGPGGTHIGADGTLSPGDKPAFSGAVELSADNLPRAIGWLASVDPGGVALSPDVLPFKSVKLTGKVKVDAAAIQATGLGLTLGRSVLSGSARLAFADHAKLTADLRAKVIDLDALPDLTALRSATSAFDLDLTLAANAFKVSQAGEGALDAGRLDLALSTTGRHLTLTNFRAQNLGGATIVAAGSLDPNGATLKATIDAARLDAFAALMRQVAPGAWADALVARAPALAPAKVSVDTTLVAAGADGALHPSRLRVEGTLGATALDVRIAPTTAQKESVTISGSLRASEGGALLRQLGLPTLPLGIIGASSVALAASGPSDRPLDTTVTANFGATQVKLFGRFGPLGVARQGSATLEATSGDLSPLAQSLALAFPDMTGTIPAAFTANMSVDGANATLDDLKGRFGTVAVAGSLRLRPGADDQPSVTGTLAMDHLALTDLTGLAFGPPQGAAAGMAWSSLRLGAGLLDPPRANLTLKIATLDLAPHLVATGAAVDLGIAPNQMTLKHATATLERGALSADLTLRRDGPSGALEGRIAVDKVAVDLPGLRTRATGTLDIAGSGPSALALVASLAGTGTASLTDTMIPGADPKVLPKLFDDVEKDDLAVDTETIARALRDRASAPLDLGTRRLGLALAGGVLQVEAQKQGAPAGNDAAVSSVFAASLDLRQPRLNETVRETLHALPKGWSGPPPSVVFAFDGPPAAPKRSVDVSAFIDAVATRALARETARIEAYESDVRERAFFNQRLLSERRREQDRLKAEADAREAAAERKAKLEAERLEIRRQEASRAAILKAAQERAAQEKAAQKAAREKAAEDQAAQDQSRGRGDPRHATEPGAGSNHSPSAGTSADAPDASRN